VQLLVVEQGLHEQCTIFAVPFDEQGKDSLFFATKVADHVRAEESDKRSRGSDALGRRLLGSCLQAPRMDEIAMVVSGEWDEHGMSRH